jgi:two-component system, OmpR family, phosphate regulon sensor histidine kinase PhoR
MNLLRLLLWLALGAGLAGASAAMLPPEPAAAFVAVVVVVTALAVRAGREPDVAPPPRLEPVSTGPSPAEVEALLDLFSEGVLLLGEDGMVLAANGAAARMLRRPRESMTGVSLIRAARDHALLDVLRAASGEPTEVTLGADQVVYATASAVDYAGFRRVLTLQDLTALRRAERARQELIANVSHELRTPITAALALAETLESGVDDPEQAERFRQQLTSELERLGTIVDRLLRLSRIESRVEEFQLGPVPLEDVLEEARRRILPVAERRGLTIEVQVAPDTPQARADRERVLEVLANLADNAIRHSPEGGTIWLRAHREAGWVRVDVKDEGPGIMPADRLRIFERFYTGDRSRGDWRGTGLGLAIARHIVTRHGGDIWVADDAPGATVSFTLEAAEEPATGAPTDPDDAEDGTS